MKVNRKELIKALNYVSAGISSKEIIEQTTSFIFQDGFVFTFNDVITASFPIDIGFDGAVPAKQFLALINKFKTEEIDIDFNGGELRVKGSKAKAGFRVESKIKVPIGDIELPEDDEWTDLPKDFIKAVSACFSSVSRDQTKYTLMCINFNGELAEATDNLRATQFTMESAPFSNPTMIPSSSLKEIIKTKPTSCSICGGWIHFMNNDELIISCRYFEGEFPDISQIITEKGAELELPKELPAILNKAETISEGGRVTITLDSKKMHISSEGSVGWFSEEVPCSYNDKPVSFEISPEYLIQIMKDEAKAVFTGTTIEFFDDESVHIVAVLPPKKK